MPATPRHRRYNQVMGECEPKVTDKRFVQDLQHKLEAKYLESQTAKERQLAEAEKKRVRKLVLEGIVEPDGRDRDNEGRSEDEWREFWPQNPNKTLEEYEMERRKAEEQRQHQEQLAAEEKRRSEEEEQQQQAEEAAEQRQEEERRRLEDQQAAAAAGKYARPESARITDLRQEEDLEQLYQKASELVYIMTPIRPKATAK